MKWDNSLTCYNSKIDSQHLNLVNLINRVNEVIKEDNYDMNQISEVVYELDEYVDYHFKFEESLMKETNYDEMEAHLKEHKIFQKKLSELNVMDLEENKSKFEDLFGFMINWLLNHIMETDKELGKFLMSIK